MKRANNTRLLGLERMRAPKISWGSCKVCGINFDHHTSTAVNEQCLRQAITAAVFKFEDDISFGLMSAAHDKARVQMLHFTQHCRDVAADVAELVGDPYNTDTDNTFQPSQPGDAESEEF